MTELARKAAELVLEPGAVIANAPPVMAGEDFAHYLSLAPGSFASLGVGTPGTTYRGPSHSGSFFLDEGALPIGIAWYIALVTNFEKLRG
jgi:amidohydrolase